MLSTIILAVAPIALRVGYVDNQFPCSYKENELWKGSAVETWANVAERTKSPFTIQGLKSPREALAALERNQIDVAVSCFNLTEERLAKFGYTSAYRFDGIKLLGKSKNEDIFPAALQTIRDSKLAEAVAILFGSTLAISLLVIIFDREVIRSAVKSDSISKRSFIRLWLWLTMGGSLFDKSQKLRVAAVGAFSHYARIIFTGALIASITAVTVKESQSSDGLYKIDNLTALRHLRIGVIEGSYSESVIRDALRGIEPEAPIKIVFVQGSGRRTANFSPAEPLTAA